MRRNEIGLFIGICFICFCSGQEASASLVSAIDFTSVGTNGAVSPSGPSSYCIGYEFQTNSAITITELGYYDDGQNGLQRYHDVGIYTNEGALLASARVSTGTTSPLTGKFRYVTLTTPLDLAAEEFFVIAAVTGTGQQMTRDVYLKNVVGLSTDPSISYIGPGLISSSTTTSLVFPTVNNTSGNIGYFGPNFRFELTPVPEPATMTILVGAVCMGLLRKKN